MVAITCPSTPPITLPMYLSVSHMVNINKRDDAIPTITDTNEISTNLPDLYSIIILVEYIAITAWQNPERTNRFTSK